MEIQYLLALLMGVSVVIALILRSRMDAFPSLLVGAIVTGLIAGMPLPDLVTSITGGFGATLSSIGIVIGLGVALGKLLEVSGGAHAIAQSFVKVFGKNKEDIAMATTGAVVSIPIFCDTGYIMVNPIARTLAIISKRSVVTLLAALAGGLVISHSLVPPTPGPLAAAGLLGLDLGQFFLAGFAFIIVLIPVVVLYARFIGPRLEPLRDTRLDDELGEPDALLEDSDQPKIRVSVALLPIILPMILILGNTLGGALLPEGTLVSILGFLGSPPIALLIGLIVALYVLPPKGTTRKETVNWLGQAAAAGGMIIFVTGAGGAFGTVLRDSGVGSSLADGVSALPLPLFLVPFIIASVVRVAQGSGTVAIITSSTLAVPLVEAGLNPLLAAMAACSGSLLFSYFNDSFFWVVTKFAGLSGTAAMKMWSGMTTVLWTATIPLLFITWFIVG